MILKNIPGFTELLASSGYALEQRDSTVFAIRLSDGAVGQDVDDAVITLENNLTKEYVAMYIGKQIDVLATAKRNKVIAAYSPGEMASWPIKREEALKFQQTGLASDAPNLNTEASYRGISIADLVTKVLNDAARFSAIEAAIAGTSGRHRDSVKSLQSIEDVMNYDYSTGWPV